MDGIIIINKNKGCTSHDIVYKVKKIFNEKVGHTGTLDPIATGVLPILIGKGTACSKYLINHDKKYEVIIQLGQKTNTADSEGTIIQEKNVDIKKLEKAELEKILKEFLGKQKQIPPMYSAIKVNGKKLYEYARKGEKVNVPPRDIEIYDIKIMEINKNNKQIKLEVECSKGTYIRVLCENISEKIGTVGYMLELKRLKVGDFELSQSITIDELENKQNDVDFINNQIISLEQLFNNKKEILLQNQQIKPFLNGVEIPQNIEDGIYKVYVYNNIKEFIGTGIVKDNKMKRDIIVKEF